MAPSNGKFVIDAVTGDVVEEVPNGGVLVHACNCIGNWGAGVALHLKKHFPEAYKLQYEYCQERTHEELMGSCLVILPQDEDSKAIGKEVYIACLFTSHGYGRKNSKTKNPGLSKKADVLTATKTALEDLRKQLDQLHSKGESDRVLEITSVKFNAGSFKVPWEETQLQIEEAFKDYGGTWIVVSPK
ncbi:ADP-ribose 1''-phosphate phosphatase [Cyphellophora attinorum]|uniref:ADP-ribose 1''-phosphate phosphatase n=1 Tax=Cyphellophora attinorum TaxID=1664694 RepID=A0A0N1P084_9EURO|nr:ADP-ribose 1''-phosphate phosphatase [Phialophora attinorum]KPI38740.1 ADP-ribose 1''-phosphate phosphatase [Phialophora attinorum]